VEKMMTAFGQISCFRNVKMQFRMVVVLFSIYFVYDAKGLIFPLNAIPAKLETSMSGPHQKKYGGNIDL